MWRLVIIDIVVLVGRVIWLLLVEILLRRITLLVVSIIWVINLLLRLSCILNYYHISISIVFSIIDFFVIARTYLLDLNSSISLKSIIAYLFSLFDDIFIDYEKKNNRQEYSTYHITNNLLLKKSTRSCVIVGMARVVIRII